MSAPARPECGNFFTGKPCGAPATKTVTVGEYPFEVVTVTVCDQCCTLSSKVYRVRVEPIR